MKLKTTKKEIQNYFRENIISIGYCKAQHLLNYKQPFAYTVGTYGWNSDIYQIGNYAIVTGYRPFGKQVDYSILKALNDKAHLTVRDRELSQHAKESRLDVLLLDLIHSAKTEG